MSRQSYILALDQGTTSSRALLFDNCGRPLAMAAREFTQHYPKPGWVEHDPMDIWSSQSAAVAEVLSAANLNSRDIAAVGLTNQRETTLLWERNSGRPVHPAIVWQDRRTAPMCEALQEQGAADRVASRTGLRLDPYFSATKVAWILDNVSGARAAAEAGKLCFGTVDSWLVWQLTGGKEHLTDATNASRTLLYNIHKGEWDADLLELFNIPRALLPEVRGCSEIYGQVASGLHPAGVPIAGIAGDQQAALFGQACFHKGMAKNTYGTGCFLLMHTGTGAVRSDNNLLTTVAWQLDGRIHYALEGSVFIGGAVIQWLRDELKLITTARECDRLAAEVSDANGLYLVPAFAGLGAPYWDPYARGLCIGLTRGSNRAHLCRAALEAIAYQTADLIHAMEKDSGLKLPELRVDGGASRSEPLLAFQSDLLGVPVMRPDVIETTARGAAALAGLAVGYWRDTDQLAEHWQVDQIFEPCRDPADMHTLYQGWKHAVERSLRWARGE